VRSAAALSTHPLPTHAVGEVVGQVLERTGDRPDAAHLLVTGPYAGALEDLAATVEATLAPGALVAAASDGVAGGAQEVLGDAAVVLFALHLDRGGARALRLDGPADREELEGAAGSLVVLADPYSFDARVLVADLATTAPGLAVVGGTVSAAAGPGGNRLGVGARIGDRGAVALHLPADVSATALVSQGVRPVSAPLVVTRSAGTLIEEVAGRPALDWVLAVAEGASPEDRRAMGSALHLGVAVDEHRVELDAGDLLVHAVLGGDKATRAIAVPAPVAVGSTVQLQVRDERAAQEELRSLLADAPGEAVLSFADVRRWAHHHGPDGDSAILHEHVEGGATAAISTALQLGPVGGRAFAHERAAAVLLLGR
jgi:small ligand-binding sensory domain FIST